MHAVLEEETKHSEKFSLFLDQRTNYKENKMNPFKSNFVLSLLLLFITAFSMDVAKAIHVDIYNDLGQGTITVHCSTIAVSGSQVLPYPKGFGFDFNPPASGAISCTFQLPGGGASHSFDIYRSDRDKCVTCSWLVRAGGPCLQHSLGLAPKEDCYPWK